MLNWNHNGNGTGPGLQGRIAECRESWIYLMNPKLYGMSGRVHEFDYGFYLNGEEDFLVLGKQYGHEIRNGLSLLTYFNAQSDDVGADRKILLSEIKLPEEVELLANALKIEVLTSISEIRSFLSRSIKDGNPMGNVKLDVSSLLSLKREDKGDKVRKKYRDRSRLIQEVLRSASSEDGTTLNNLVFKCNLNYNSARKIVDELINRELLGIIKDEKDKTVYKTTGNGSQMIEKLRSINGAHLDEQ